MAHAVACQTLPAYSCRFSRKDFTLPQLFACLVVKDLLKRSYRGAEALLRDSQLWLNDIGMDHPLESHCAKKAPRSDALAPIARSACDVRFKSVYNAAVTV